MGCAPAATGWGHRRAFVEDWTMPSRLRFGDVEIDLEAFELRRGGTLTPVEPQVFELVCYLARHPGRLITKGELIETVWNGRIVSDAAVASRIKSARRAIGDDGEQQRWIKTVHGRGVRFVGDGSEPAPAAAERPSIAVPPFEALGGGAEEASLADGLTEDIITDLARVSALFVVARNFVFPYQGRKLPMPQVARELDVSYVLEGSLRRTDGRVRVTAQLIDGR